MLRFIIGFIIGGLSGIFTLSLCISANEKKLKKEIEEEE